MTDLEETRLRALEATNDSVRATGGFAARAIAYALIYIGDCIRSLKDESV